MIELNFIIKPDKLEQVKEILVDEFHCGGMTVHNVLGCGEQKGFTEEYVGVRTHVNLLPKMHISVVVKDEDVDRIIDEICDRITTGHYGDGKIFIKDVIDAVRVRTKERGDKAI